MNTFKNYYGYENSMSLLEEREDFTNEYQNYFLEEPLSVIQIDDPDSFGNQQPIENSFLSSDNLLKNSNYSLEEPPRSIPIDDFNFFGNQQSIENSSSFSINLFQKENDFKGYSLGQEENIKNNFIDSLEESQRAMHIDELEHMVKIQPKENLSSFLGNLSFNKNQIKDKDSMQTNQEKLNSTATETNKKEIFIVNRAKENSRQGEYRKVLGRKRKEEKEDQKTEDNNKKNKTHDKYSTDNILIKLKNHYDNFIIDYANFLVKKIYPKNSKIKFYYLSYEFKRNIKNLESLKHGKISNFLKNEQTKKCFFVSKTSNIDLVKKLEDENSAEINEFLNKNYLSLFHEIYEKSSEDLNKLGIKIPKKTEILEDLIDKQDFDEKEIEKKELFSQKIKSCIKNYFSPH